MKTIFTPTMIVDGFFNNPDAVRDFALKLQYQKDTEGRWPGVRSDIHDSYPVFFNQIMNKIVSMLFSTDTLVSYTAQMSFQIVDQSYEMGWVHKDNSCLTALIYLTPDSTSGTSIYTKKDCLNYLDSTFRSQKQESYKTNNIDSDSRNIHNNQYTENINIKGLYNRLVLFDSHLYHAAHEFLGNELGNSRLTLISFIKISSSADFLPGIRSNIVGGGL